MVAPLVGNERCYVDKFVDVSRDLNSRISRKVEVNTLYTSEFRSLENVQGAPLKLNVQSRPFFLTLQYLSMALRNTLSH